MGACSVQKEIDEPNLAVHQVLDEEHLF